MEGLTSDGFRLEAEDEFSHPPDGASNFNESVYMNGFDPAQRVGGWMRLGNRVNEGFAELSVCLYLPDGRIACQFQRPAIDSNDRFSAGGLTYECTEPFRRATMTFTGEVIVPSSPEALRDPREMFAGAPRAPAEVVLEATAISPIHGGVPTSSGQETLYGQDFSRAHFSQHTQINGSIRIREEQWRLDGWGWRDHSWGPRFWQAIYAYRLLLAGFGEDRAFMLLKNISRDGRARRLGVVLADGVYEEVVDLDVVTEWTDTAEPVRMRINVGTASRRGQIEARVLTLAPLRNRRRADGQTLESRIAEGFTEYTWGDRVGYGMAEYIERIEDGVPLGYPL